MFNIYLNLEEGIGSKWFQAMFEVWCIPFLLLPSPCVLLLVKLLQDNIQTSAPENYLLLLLFHEFHGRLILILKFSKIPLVVPMVVGYFSMNQLFSRCSWLEAYFSHMFDGHNPIFVIELDDGKIYWFKPYI